MATSELVKGFNGLGLESQVIALALPVILDRVNRLAKEDRDALLELVKELPNVKSKDDMVEMVATMLEIIELKPGTIIEMGVSEGAAPPSNLAKWLEYVSKKVRDARAEADLTQEQLAEKTGLPQSHISRIENGKLSPSRKTLERLAKALNKPVTDFDPCV